jgi:curved DNA-binding protein CbpA
MSHFDVLGVAGNACDEEIAAAHRQLARQFHPDAHPGASAAERADYEAAMTRINVAYDALKTLPRRTRYFRSDEEPSEPGTASRPPSVGECDLCGAAPADHFVFEHQSAWVLTGRRHTSAVELCRQCASAMGRAHQNRTLYSGWWGVTALFTNFGVLARNGLQLRRASNLARPTMDPNVVAPLAEPSPETRGLFRRGGVWFAALALSGILVAVVLLANPHSPTQGRPTAPAAAVDRWVVDDCISGTLQPSPVDCNQPHDGRIVQRVAIPGACPVGTDAYLRHGAGISNVYCIDTDS